MNKCVYCKRSGVLRVRADDSPLKENMYVCDMHWEILKNPNLALQFLRGHLSMNLRDERNSEINKKRIDKFFDIIKNWKPTRLKD